MKNLEKYNILLASKSPRRRELLSSLRIPFNVVTMGGIKEEYPEEMPAENVPEFLSVQKADAYKKILKPDDLLITADTVVILDNEILGKPQNTDDARRMLRALSGRSHIVATGVTISTVEKQVSFTAITEVRFAPLDDSEIEYYILNFYPFDKAGSYGIQEWIGSVAVESISGSFYNVMGLPLHRLYKELKGF